MNTICFTHANPQYLPRVFLQDDECVAGPHYSHWRKGGKWKFMNTPGGQFDYSIVTNQSEGVTSFDTIVVHADSTMGCLPRNLPANATKVLLVGDTHHLSQPIQKLIAYAASEPFDAIVLWNRQHAHFFTEYGLQNIFWLPGLIFAIPEGRKFDNRKKQIAFFGQLGPHHPRRQRIVTALKAEGVSLVGGTMPRSDSLDLVAQSLASLNISLNGEWNLRVFETTSRGALLLTDRLSHYSGLSLFYPENESQITYDNSDELQRSINQIIKNPDGISAIAQKGYETTQRHFSFAARKETFFALVEDGITLDLFRLQGEPRCALPIANREALVRRIQIYEWMQELHRVNETVSIFLAPGVSPLVISDLADLVRLNQHLIIDEATFTDAWKPALAELQIPNLNHLDETFDRLPASSILVASIQDLDTLPIQKAVLGKQSAAVLISDYHSDNTQLEEAMIKAGYKPNHDVLSGLYIKP